MRRLWTSWTELLNKSCCFVSSCSCFVLGVGLDWGLDLWGGVGMLGAGVLGGAQSGEGKGGKQDGVMVRRSNFISALALATASAAVVSN